MAVAVFRKLGKGEAAWPGSQEAKACYVGGLNKPVLVKAQTT